MLSRTLVYFLCDVGVYSTFAILYFFALWLDLDDHPKQNNNDILTINETTTQDHNDTMDEARYRELREKMAAVKSLYGSRHYSQCAKLGELLLSEMHDQVSMQQQPHTMNPS